MPPLFTGVIKIGVVVRELDASIRRYEAYGIGPWSIHDVDPQAAWEAPRWGERPHQPFRVAVAAVGGIGWELVQPLVDEGLYAEFLARRGEGVHHVSLSTPDFDEAVSSAHARGRRVLQGGRVQGIEHAYLSTDEDLGVVVEIYDGLPGGEGMTGITR